MLAAIIVAGGSSRRMGFDKTFALLHGKPVIAHAIAAFAETKSVSEIILVGRAERLSELQQFFGGKVRQIVSGGSERQDSVAHGLRALSGEVQFIAVHDAARPLVRPEQIEEVFACAKDCGAAALAAPVRDTLKRADVENCVAESIARENVFAMETPQIFTRDLLQRAYAAVGERGLVVTDEVSALEAIGQRVKLVPNRNWNFKITYQADLELAEALLRGQSRLS